MNSSNCSAALDSPKISVVICNYNYERFIGAAIDSAINQEYSAHEIIVVDDGSTDRSSEIILAYSNKLIFSIFKANEGQSSAYNAGFAVSTGDLVLFLDSDDSLAPNALLIASKAFTNGVVKFHFRLELINESGDKLGVLIPRHLASGNVSKTFLKHGVLHASPPASGNVYRKTTLDFLFPLPIDQEDRHGADFFCIYGASLFGEVACAESVLGFYRVSNRGLSPGIRDFGNAMETYNASVRLERRLRRLKDWIADRSGSSIITPEAVIDFSTQKVIYAKAALIAWKSRANWRRATTELPKLMTSIWLRPELGIAYRLLLTFWGVLILIAPRTWAMKAALYVCNPINRISR